MGNVNELDEENKNENNQSTNQKTSSEYFNDHKLQRDLNNKVLAGVCSGVANYFDIDPTLVRVIFLIVFFIFGSGGLLYIILWIVMKPTEEVDLPSSNYQNKKHQRQCCGY